MLCLKLSVGPPSTTLGKTPLTSVRHFDLGLRNFLEALWFGVSVLLGLVILAAPGGSWWWRLGEKGASLDVKGGLEVDFSASHSLGAKTE